MIPFRNEEFPLRRKDPEWRGRYPVRTLVLTPLELIDKIAALLARVSSHLELLDAQREHFAAQQSALAVRRQLLSTAASFCKALGGGTAER